MWKKIFDKFSRNSDERTSKAQKNILYSFAIKGASVVTYLLLVPITLKFLTPIEYGIWLTLSSILMWINTFDIGLGNGLRNTLAEAIAKKDYLLGRILISTTYAVLFVVMMTVFLLFFTLNSFLNWFEILNVDNNIVPNLNKIVLISFALFCVTFVLKLIGNIYLALQRPAVNNLLVMAGQLLSLILIFILSKYKEGSLFSVAVIYSASPIVIYIIAYPFTFLGSFKKLMPSIKLIRKEYIRPLFSLGGQFFILQIGGLVIFSTSNLLIAHMFGPENVTVYNIAYRYYSVVPMLFSIILTPLWSATTDAYVRDDLIWIRKSMNKVKKLMFITSIGLVIMTISSNFIYKFWIGDDIEIPIWISILMAIYIYVLVISLSYSSFLNGLGKLRIQVINIFFASILFLPLTYFLSAEFGLKGVIISLILVNSSGVIFNYIQFNRLLNKTATGVWNR